MPDVERLERTIEAKTRAAPTAKERERFDTWWFLVLAVACVVALLAIVKPDPFLRIILFLRDGIGVTVRITVISFVFILIVGLIGGLGRLAKNWLIHGIASLYVEIIRGIPLLVQLLFLYFAFPQVLDTVGAWLIKLSPSLHSVGKWLVDVKPDPFVMAVAGLTICYGAYMSEIYRAGIQSISKGQMEAARSLGMSYFQAMRYVILPQAVRVILPPVGNGRVRHDPPRARVHVQFVHVAGNVDDGRPALSGHDAVRVAGGSLYRKEDRLCKVRLLSFKEP